MLLNSKEATATPRGTPFVPANDDWEFFSIDLTEILGPGMTTANIAILNWNGFGNNIFLDNISIQLNSILPVEIVRFRGEAINNKSRIYWNTASEYNVDYYSLERSSDGISFNEIAQIKGYEDSVFGHEYIYIDESPEKGVNYYRLTAVDYDGSVTKSDLISVNHSFISSELFSIGPNPTNGILEINFEIDDLVKFVITNSSGQFILEEMIVPQVSWHFVDLSDFSNGVYFMTFVYDGQLISERIVKN